MLRRPRECMPLGQLWPESAMLRGRFINNLLGIWTPDDNNLKKAWKKLKNSLFWVSWMGDLPSYQHWSTSLILPFPLVTTNGFSSKPIRNQWTCACTFHMAQHMPYAHGASSLAIWRSTDSRTPRRRTTKPSCASSTTGPHPWCVNLCGRRRWSTIIVSFHYHFPAIMICVCHVPLASVQLVHLALRVANFCNCFIRLL